MIREVGRAFNPFSIVKICLLTPFNEFWVCLECYLFASPDRFDWVKGMRACIRLTVRRLFSWALFVVGGTGLMVFFVVDISRPSALCT